MGFVFVNGFIFYKTSYFLRDRFLIVYFVYSVECVIFVNFGCDPELFLATAQVFALFKLY